MFNNSSSTMNAGGGINFNMPHQPADSLLPNGQNPFLQSNQGGDEVNSEMPLNINTLEGQFANVTLNNNTNNAFNQDKTPTQIGGISAVTESNDEELKKKIALYYHTLFQGSLAQWFVLLQQKNYTKLTKKQYIDLNMRIQKSLILDFDMQSAQESALEDWKIDIERESGVDKKNSTQNTMGSSDGANEKKDSYLIEFERLSEFFFDLCLSWCQHLELEVFLYFVNGIFLNITKGAHVNVSEFKPIEEIEVLSIEFFNQLLHYRSRFEQINLNGGEGYQAWYARNFGRQGELVKHVEKNLNEAFKHKITVNEKGEQQAGENRILDLWMDMPATNPAHQNGYLAQHFEKLDKDFSMMQKATKAQTTLIQSMNMMDQQQQMRMTEKHQKLKATGANFNPLTYEQNHQQEQQQPYIMLNNTNENPQQTAQNTQKTQKTKRFQAPTGQNLRETKQSELEKQLLGQLGDRFKHAKLLEVSEGSYLITMDVRLPVFGKALQLKQREKKSMLAKGANLLSQDPQKYTSQRSRVELGQLNQSHMDPLSIIDAFSEQPTSSVNVGQNLLTGKNVVYNKQSSVQRQQQQRRLVGDHYLAGGTMESDGEQQQFLAQQQHLQQHQMSFDNHQQNQLPNDTQHQQQYQQQQSFTYPTMQQYGQQQQISSSPMVDEQTLKLVYDRYLQMLQEDKNATIDDVLQQEDIKRQLAYYNNQQTQYGPVAGPREIEAAVIERLQAEEESAEIQDMIARFYNKFDELHEQSVQAALAKSPNKQLVKNEIKYKIPEKWTRPFYKHDIVGKILADDNFNASERGRVNKQGVATNRYYKSLIQNNQDGGQGVQDSMQALVLQNQFLQQSMPLNNGAFQGPNSSVQITSQDPNNKVSSGQETSPSHLISPHLQEQAMEKGDYDQQAMYSPIMNGGINDAMSTDVSARGGNQPDQENTTQTKNREAVRPTRYDWSEVAHLFEDGVVPEELQAITDPIEYNYILVRLKRDFNEAHKSEYMKYMNLQLPYHSRRDEIGGAITNEEWGNFIDRLEGIIDRVNRRRKRIIRRRKKKGIKKLPRKTLFKPIKRPDMSKDPLWCEVFLDHSDGGGSDSGDDESSSDELLRQHKKLIFGLQSANQQKRSENIGIMPNARIGLNSAKEKDTQKKPLKSTLGGGATSEFTLPPILKPLLEDKPKAKKKGKGSKNPQAQLKNAEANFIETAERFPGATSMMNLRLRDLYYKDPFDQLDPHKPSRILGADVPATVKKVEHTYTKKVKKQFKRSIERLKNNNSETTGNMMSMNNNHGHSSKNNKDLFAMLVDE